MTIVLTPELEKLVQAKVARGEYHSPDALVGEAIQRLLAEDDEEAALRDHIRARVDAAEGEIDRGEFKEYDETNLSGLTRDVHQRGLERRAAVRSTPRSGG